MGVALSYEKPLMRGSVARVRAVVLEVRVQTHDFINLDLQSSTPPRGSGYKCVVPIRLSTMGNDLPTA